MALLHSDTTDGVEDTGKQPNGVEGARDWTSGEANQSTSILDPAENINQLNIAPDTNDMQPNPQYDENDFIDMDLNNLWSVPTTPKDQSPRCDSPMATAIEALDDHNLEPDESPKTKYGLRPQTHESKVGFTSTWIDQDETGDFDPSEELRKARLYRHRLKLRSQQCVRPRVDRFDEDDAEGEALPKLVPTLMVKLHFSSEAKIKFEEVVSSLPVKPKQTQEVLSGYQLRRRNRGVTFTYNDDYDANKSRFAPHLPEKPTGHPFARGCWQCITLGHECPLLTDETAWPCSTCVEDDNDCQLVIPPEFKRACERCKRRRVGCSYSNTLNHGVACQQCMEDGHYCVAGPAKDTIRTRIRYDRDWTSNPLPTKKARKAKDLSTCAECSEAERPCSFSAGGSNGLPCVACKTNGEACKLEHFVPQQRKKTEKYSSGHKRMADEGPQALLPSTKRPKIHNGCEGIHKTIETKLCHPIIFNCDDNQNGKEFCHFCEEPGYGILGLGTKQVEVIEWKDGRGLEEISGGHRGEGIENTRLCALCTTSRMTIIMCPQHEMRPITDAEKDAVDLNDALSELLSGITKNGRQWCAICPSLASYECRTPCDDDIDGCGLKLCEYCMMMLVGSHDGDLQSMLPGLKDEPTKEKMLGLRADYELLKQDGLLMRFMLWSSR